MYLRRMKENTIEDQMLARLGIEQLNEMQLAAIEAVLKPNDLVLLSPTGSGKTLAFLLPLVQMLEAGNAAIQAIILVPSRELASQIEDVFKRMQTGFKVTCCYGGHAVRTEVNNLQEPPALLIGTPGRVVDHINRGNVKLAAVRTIVLDEFDKSLELGFYNEMATVMDHLPSLKKRILTSATESVDIPAFMDMKQPMRLNFLNKGPKAKREIKKVVSEEKDKLGALLKLISKLGNQSMLIFLNHRQAVERVSDFLHDQGVVHDYFHGGLEQTDRERTLAKFRNGSCPILISTDLAARGLDVPDIAYVIHYQMPPKEDAFIHRNGRTARMDAKGVVYLLLSEDEKQPGYIPDRLRVEELPEEMVLPAKPEWATLFIGKGKKDKINKIDIVGFLCKQGKLDNNEIGLIEVKDHFSYAAVKRSKISQVIKLVKREKLKNQRAKIEQAM